MTAPSAPRIIAFEGMDGAGKSTVIAKVAEALRARGVSVLLPRSGKEHDSRPTRHIRRLTRDPRNVDLSPRAELSLYCAREAQVLDEVVRPAVARGETVLLDRSLLTPVVLGAWGRGLPRQQCEQVAAVASDGLEPDVTLIFDVHPRTSRLRKRVEKVRDHNFEPGGRKGLSGSGLKERVRRGYLELAAERGWPVFHVERITPDQLAARVCAVLFEGARPEALEDPLDAVPAWQLAREVTLGEAIDALPLPVALYLTNGLQAARELRRRSLELEPQLCAWGMDATDPLLERAAEVEPIYALRSLTRRPLEDGDQRLELLESHPAEALAALRYLVGGHADALREQWAEREPGATTLSLMGREDALAWALRDRCWKRSGPIERAQSLTGCQSDRAWKLRDALVSKDPVLALSSLRGVPGARADALLSRYAAHAPKPALRALGGRSDAFAHELREALWETGREVIDSVRGLDDEASWEIRQRGAEHWPSTVIDSLRGLGPGARRDAMVAECQRLGAGDAHVLRRVAALDEEPLQPTWLRQGPSEDD